MWSLTLPALPRHCPCLLLVLTCPRAGLCMQKVTQGRLDVCLSTHTTRHQNIGFDCENAEMAPGCPAEAPLPIAGICSVIGILRVSHRMPTPAVGRYLPSQRPNPKKEAPYLP